MDPPHETHFKEEDVAKEWPFRYITDLSNSDIRSYDPGQSMLAAQSDNSSFPHCYHHNEFSPQHIHYPSDSVFSPPDFSCYDKYPPVGSRFDLVRPIPEQAYPSPETSQRSNSYSSDFSDKPCDPVFVHRSPYSEQLPLQVNQTTPTAGFGHYQPNYLVKFVRHPNTFQAHSMPSAGSPYIEQNYRQSITPWVPRPDNYSQNGGTEAVFRAPSASSCSRAALKASQDPTNQCMISEPSRHSRAVQQDKCCSQPEQISGDVRNATHITQLSPRDNEVACCHQGNALALAETLPRSDDAVVKTVKREARANAYVPKQEVPRCPSYATSHDGYSGNATALSPTPKTSRGCSTFAKQIDNSNATGPPTATEKRRQEDAYLKQARREGKSYAKIKDEGEFRECVSTLRGRHRNITKAKHERVRKPEWKEIDNALLVEIVLESYTRNQSPSHTTGPGLRRHQSTSRCKPKLSWKAVSEEIVRRGGSYEFSYAGCRKKFDKLCEANPAIRTEVLALENL